jgi:acetolactate synthase regulatory subunit
MPLSRFDIVARADPQVLLRLLNYFAQRGLLPSRVRATQADGLVMVHVEQSDLDEEQACIIVEKMRTSVLVEAIRIRRGRRLLTWPSGDTDDLSTQ